MGEAISLQTRRALLKQFAPQYRKASSKRKRLLLDAFAEATGYHRRYGMWLLNHAEEIHSRPRSQRAPRYGPEVQRVLFLVWHAANRICTKRLMPYLPTWLDVLERHEAVQITPQCRAQLLAMSAATADRLLRSQRMHGLRGISTTKAGTLLKQQIPIRTYQQWNEHRPGFLEADLVAHCGTHTEGNYLYTLTLTDIATGWTECLPLLNKSQEMVLEAVKQARALFPFPILGIDTDCGSEFVNEAFVAYCEQEHLTFTRGRPKVKSDQCFIEQKNGHSVRQVIGHDRLEGMRAYQQFKELYHALRLYVNCFQPSMKLLEKRREDSHVRRMYDPAKTPLQRLLLSGSLPADKQEALQMMADALNPVRLFEQLKQLQQAVFRRMMSAAPFSSPAATPALLRFVLEDCSSIALQASTETALDPEAVLQALRQKQQRRYHLLDWKRTRHDPFAGEWEQILAWMQANSELTGAEIFRALERRSPGRYRPTHLRTLQRGMHQIRTRLLEMGEESWPSEALPADVPADPLIPGREEECEPSSGALHTASLCLPLSQDPADAGPAPCSLPPEQETPRALEPVTSSEDKRVIREGKKRRRVSRVPQPSVTTNAFVAPMTVEHAISLYLQDLVAKKRSPKTIEWHRTALGFLQEYLQQTCLECPLAHLTRREIRGWVAWLRTEPGATGTQRSANTVNTYLRSARAFGAFLVRQGYLESTLFGAIALPKAKKPRLHLVEQEVFDQVLLACQPPGESSALRTEAAVRNRALLWVLLETGLLVSEVCALRLVDVDRKRGLLRVRGKGSRKRQVPLGPDSQQSLLAYLDQYRLKVHGHAGEDPLFLTETGRPLTPNAITLLSNRLIRRAGLTGTRISPSMLRDTFAVRFLQAGGEPHTLHERLGVENWETIKHYQQMSDQQGKEQRRREIPVPPLS